MRRFSCGVLALVACVWTPRASADFASLTVRLPAETDAIVAVNVEKLLASPLATTEKWGQVNLADWASSPVMVAPGATRVLAGIGMSAADEMEPAWEICLTEMSPMPSLDALVDAEAGYLDRLWDKDAVHSPVNAYFIPLDKQVLASITPADRRGAVRWLREPAAATPALKSPYLAGVVKGLKEQTHVLMAMDLEGVASVPEIRRRLDEAELPELKDKDLAALAQVLGSTLGVTFTANASDKLVGKAVVQFKDDPAVLAPVAKPLVASVLRRHGLWLDDLEGWKYAVNGRALTMEGELSSAALRKLLWLAQTPMPAATVPNAVKTGAAQAKATDANGKPVDAAQASLRYYKSITSILDGFSPQMSASATAVWFRRGGKRIDQLPILGVDPELVKWGSAVSAKFKELAGGAAVTQTQINARVAGVRSSDYGGYGYDGSGYYKRTSDAAGAEQRRYNQAKAQESRAAALEQKAQAQQAAIRALDEMVGSREQIRAQMVSKYNIEF